MEGKRSLGVPVDVKSRGRLADLGLEADSEGIFYGSSTKTGNKQCRKGVP